MLAKTSTRVTSNTADYLNERIRQQTEWSVAKCVQAGPEAIERRLRELDREWDIERCVETMAPSFSLFGLALGLLGSKKWFLLPVVVQSFFLQHALQGWCPPIPLLRRLGIRTMQEIEAERHALKALRGDYGDISREQPESAETALLAAQL